MITRFNCTLSFNRIKLHCKIIITDKLISHTRTDIEINFCGKVHDHNARVSAHVFSRITLSFSTETGHGSGFVYQISMCEVFTDDTLQTLHMIKQVDESKSSSNSNVHWNILLSCNTFVLLAENEVNKEFYLYNSNLKFFKRCHKWIFKCRWIFITVQDRKLSCEICIYVLPRTRSLHVWYTEMHSFLSRFKVVDSHTWDTFRENLHQLSCMHVKYVVRSKVSSPNT